MVNQSTKPLESGRTMEPILMSQQELSGFDEENLRVHAWRAEQLRELGVSRVLAELFADAVDWHAIASLVQRGCPPLLALEIVL
jgi:hypothetical protein